MSYSQQNLGSARSLKGDIYVLYCFVSDNNHEWSSQEKKDVVSKYREATNWIKNQATLYNDTVNFTNGSYGMNADVKLDQIVSGTGSKNEDARMVTLVLRQFGYTNSLSFYNWVIKNTKCTNALVFIFAKGQGRSYSMVYQSGMSEELYFMEGAMFFEKQSNGVPLSSSTIAHEMLHLFGAWDFYRTFEQTQDREDRVRKMFPNSIMLRTSHNINELSVDEVTAWLIGWKSDHKPWYEWFKPSVVSITTETH